MTTEAAAPRPRGFRGAMTLTLLRLPFLFALTMAAYVAASVALELLPKRAPAAWIPAALLAVGLAVSALMILAYRGLIRGIEGRAAAELARTGAARGVASGVALGAALFTTVYVLLYATGCLTFLGKGGLDGLAASLATSVMAAVGEELILRGVVFRVLEDGFGTLVALVFSGALFGLLHLGNPGATLLSAGAIAVEAGVLLGVAYAATRSLWLPIGLHFGWNFTEGGVFGAAVSGTESRGLLRFAVAGHPLLTGGSFGPEASVPAVVVCLAGAAGLGVLVVRRGTWQRLRFRMRLA